MRRREFIGAVGAMTVGSSLVAWEQHRRCRRLDSSTAHRSMPSIGPARMKATSPRIAARGGQSACERWLPILCTYMARRAPAFVRNKVLARHINIAHGLYPRAPLSDAELRAVLAYLRSFTSTTGGRTYAGGLIKFEPKELERTLLPRLEDIHIICSGSTVWPTSPPS
jgi:hypothetical protein